MIGYTYNDNAPICTILVRDFQHCRPHLFVAVVTGTDYIAYSTIEMDAMTTLRKHTSCADVLDAILAELRQIRLR